MTITAEKLEKAFNELVKEIGDNEIWEYIGYQFYPSKEDCQRFEITISCTVPDRNVAIGGIELQGPATEYGPNFLTYINPGEIEISNWDIEDEEYKTPKEILKELIDSIYYDIERTIEFEEFVNSWLKDIVDNI